MNIPSVHDQRQALIDMIQQAKMRNPALAGRAGADRLQATVSRGEMSNNIGRGGATLSQNAELVSSHDVQHPKRYNKMLGNHIDLYA